ncbi:hypothetical protein [Georgenia faecalis]|uniref:DUF2231 domain-containing protein n=1 Tax=Georgenia faecalis TaxID=2483799 RepID=A0ABV9DF89_9MICO|nr:hypothetical protein [Georgenia faecalis]
MITHTTPDPGGRRAATAVPPRPLAHGRRLEVGGLVVTLAAGAVAAGDFWWSWWTVAAWILAYAGGVLVAFAGGVRRHAAGLDEGSLMMRALHLSGWLTIVLGVAISTVNLAGTLGDPAVLGWWTPLVNVIGAALVGAGVGVLLVDWWVRPRGRTGPYRPW